MKKISFVLLLAMTLLIPVFVLAADPKVGTASEEPPKLASFSEFIQSNNSGPIFNFLVAVGYVLGIIGIVYAGVLYLTAFGSEERPGLAKKAIYSVIIGISIIVLARVIVGSIVPADLNKSVINQGLNPS